MALSLFTHLIQGFPNRDLRRYVVDLLGGRSRFLLGRTDDLRSAAPGTEGSDLPAASSPSLLSDPNGWKVARLMTRLEARVLAPGAGRL